MQHLKIENKEYVIIDNIMIAHDDVTSLKYHDAVLYCSVLQHKLLIRPIRKILNTL